MSRVGGLTGYYFPGSKLARPVAVRTDASVDFSSAGRVGSAHGALTGEAAAAAIGILQQVAVAHAAHELKMEFVQKIGVVDASVAAATSTPRCEFLPVLGLRRSSGEQI